MSSEIQMLIGKYTDYTNNTIETNLKTTFDEKKIMSSEFQINVDWKIHKLH